MTARLVILGPEHPHAGRDKASPAVQEVDRILNWRGSAPRLYQNMLSFLAPDGNRLSDLEEAIRQYLAWKSIDEERDVLNLDAFQGGQARTKREQADDTVDARIQEVYIWLLVPDQADPRDPKTLEWQESRLQGRDPLTVRASKRLKGDEYLIDGYSAIHLRLAIDQYGLL